MSTVCMHCVHVCVLLPRKWGAVADALLQQLVQIERRLVDWSVLEQIHK